MRCTQCDYTLWNVRGRTCPECGAQFNPAEAVFEPNLVEFCCPHCEQPYYGTDHNGLIIPRDFVCVRCGKDCSLATNMFLRLAPGASDADVTTDTIPWTQTQDIGYVKAWWRTLLRCVGAPSRIGKGIGAVPATRSVSWLALSCLGPLLGISFFFLFVIGMGTMAAGPSRYGTTGAALLEGFLSFLLSVVSTVAVVFLIAMLAAGISWLVLGMSSEKPEYSRLFACWSYACAPLILTALPCFGFYCLAAPVAVWIAVLAGIMMAYATRARTGPVVMAAIAPPVVMGLLVFGSIATLIAVNVAAAPPMVGGPPSSGPGGAAPTPAPAVKDFSQGPSADPSTDPTADPSNPPPPPSPPAPTSPP